MGPTHLAWRRRVSSGAAFTATPGRCRRDTTTNSQVVVAAARRGDYGTAVGHQDTSLAQTPNESAPILAGVAFFGTFFAAMAMRKRRGRDARDDGTDQRRRVRGEVVRQRLRTAAGRTMDARVATRSDLGEPASFPNPNYRWSDDSRSARDIAFARTRGLVRDDKSRGRVEDYELLREMARRDEDAERENIARDSRSPAGGAFDGMSFETTTITLGVSCPVREGQGLALTGAARALGSWDLNRAVTMTRVGADRWQVTFETDPGAVEYRFALITRLPTGGAQLETETGAARSAVAVTDAGSAQVIVDQRTPEFKSGSNLDWSGRIRAGAAGNVDAKGSSRTARRGPDPGAAQRVADASDVDVETAREALEMTGGDERRAGELLRTAAMGVPPSPPPPPPGRRMSPREAAAAAAAAAKADRMRVDQLSDDVRVVEEFSDASDDELARLIADLQNEMKNN